MLAEHPALLISAGLFALATLYLWIVSFIAIARSRYSPRKKATWFLLLLLFPPVFLVLLYRHLFHK